MRERVLYSVMGPARRLMGYVAPYRRSFVLGFLCAIMATSLSLAGPWVLMHAVDDLHAGVTMGKVRFYSIAILSLAAIGGLFRFSTRRIVIGASRQIEYGLRNAFFARLQQLELGYFQQHRTGDLMSRATNDLSAVRMMIGPAVMYTATTGLTAVVAIALMLSIDVRLTLLSLIPLPVVSFVVRYFGRAIHRRFEAIQAQLSDISAMVQENLSGVRIVRAYGQEAVETDRFKEVNEEYVRRNEQLIRLMGIYNPSMGLLMGVGALIVLWLGSREVVTGRMTVGELVAFNSYLMMLSWPMIAFGWVTNLLQRGMASWKRMLEVLDTQPAITDAEAATEIDPASIRGDIEFRHLTFAFGAHTVLQDVSVTIPAGSTTAILGATGSGKSTLLSLLPRLHEPPPGTVFLDGTDVRRLPLAALRQAIGFVPQEPFLFSASLADNVAFGGASSVSVEEAAQIARLDKDVQDFPHGYDTVVGERGITLSGGQKQRTALARALVTNPKILVLDDALSAVDTYTEEEILSRLRGVMRQRTSIIVAHRVSTVRAADQILVLAGGRIAERGTHDELLRHNGLYAEMYRRQLLEEELAAS